MKRNSLSNIIYLSWSKNNMLNRFVMIHWLCTNKYISKVTKINLKTSERFFCLEFSKLLLEKKRLWWLFEKEEHSKDTLTLWCQNSFWDNENKIWRNFEENEKWSKSTDEKEYYIYIWNLKSIDELNGNTKNRNCGDKSYSRRKFLEKTDDMIKESYRMRTYNV